MDLSIIILSYNTAKVTLDCINSIIENTSEINYEIIVVDNASSDDSVQKIKTLFLKKGKIKHKLIGNTSNLGFSRANNQGLKIAQGEFVLFLNSDTLIHDNVLSEIVEWLRNNSKVGIVSCSLVNKDGSIQGTGGYFPTLLRVFVWMTIQDLPFVDRVIKPFHPSHGNFKIVNNNEFYQSPRELDWVTGAFLFTRKSICLKVGGFDENYFMYTEDTDLCFRTKEQGWEVFYLPNWQVTHLGGASGSSWSHVVPEYKGVKLFYKKFYPAWQYPILRLLLRLGAIGRMVVFGLISGKVAFKAYAKAFNIA